MKLYIKNMVCNRCTMVVQDVMDSLDIGVSRVLLGEVRFVNNTLTDNQIINIEEKITPLGFELIDDKKVD